MDKIRRKNGFKITPAPGKIKGHCFVKAMLTCYKKSTVHYVFCIFSITLITAYGAQRNMVPGWLYRF